MTRPAPEVVIEPPDTDIPMPPEAVRAIANLLLNLAEKELAEAGAAPDNP